MIWRVFLSRIRPFTYQFSVRNASIARAIDQDAVDTVSIVTLEKIVSMIEETDGKTLSRGLSFVDSGIVRSMESTANSCTKSR